MEVRLLFVHALSPLHAGTGQSLGAIDLAIARDRATGYPYLPGSSIKGALRDRSQARASGETVAVFGPDTDRAHEHAGALLCGDANLLLLPIRSVRGTFAWATSPYLLRRFARDAREAGLKTPAVPEVTELTKCLVTTGEPSITGDDRKVILEDLDCQATNRSEVGDWAKLLGGQLFDGDPAWCGMLSGRLCILHDNVMSYLSQHATDVVARVALEDDSKTVTKGGLWYEENLPTETVLVALMGAQANPRSKATPDRVFIHLESLCAGAIQLGGKATVGRGRCRLVATGRS